MGSRSEYHCKNCGKDWVEDLQLFYLMGDDKLEHHGYVMMTPDIERRSLAKGYVSETYCTDCDKDIKLYLIEEVKTKYPNFDTSRIIEEYKRDSNKIFGTVEEFKEGTVVQCPKCKHEITLEEGFNLEDEFNLNCNVYGSYCDYCDEEYEFYAVKPSRRDYTKQEAFEKIRKLLDKEYMLGFEESYLNQSEIDCPCCGKKIPIQNSFDKCPKCDGELEGGLTMLYD